MCGGHAQHAQRAVRGLLTGWIWPWHAALHCLNTHGSLPSLQCTQLGRRCRETDGTKDQEPLTGSEAIITSSPSRTGGASSLAGAPNSLALTASSCCCSCTWQANKSLNSLQSQALPAKTAAPCKVPGRGTNNCVARGDARKQSRRSPAAVAAALARLAEAGRPPAGGRACRQAVVAEAQGPHWPPGSGHSDAQEPTRHLGAPAAVPAAPAAALTVATTTAAAPWRGLPCPRQGPPAALPALRGRAAGPAAARRRQGASQRGC